MCLSPSSLPDYLYIVSSTQDHGTHGGLQKPLLRVLPIVQREELSSASGATRPRRSGIISLSGHSYLEERGFEHADRNSIIIR